MPRSIQPETEAVNADSFLDIVASVVSIMIIMVLMTGLKIKNTPVDVVLAGNAPALDPGLTADLETERALRGDVLKTATEIRKVMAEAEARQQHRDMLATLVTALERKAESGREQTAQPLQEDMQTSSQIAQMRARLGDLERQREAIENAPETPVQVECYPTPLSRVVDGHEVHFQLRGGRIAYIPLDSLQAKFKADATQKIYKLRDLPEITETIGPEGGFRFRYTLERFDLPPEEALRSGRGGSLIRLQRWTLIPMSDGLGEPIDEALKEGSKFRQALSRYRPGESTMTIWTYPDSFDAFRRIKKELFQMGFPVAARPLPEGIPIAGSPEGSKSAAE